MPFRWSCFVSYRHIEGDLSRRFIQELERALKSYVTSWVEDLGVYVDETRLEGGDYFDARLEKALCESVCLILVYTPGYFDKHNTYCAREYQSMIELEKERLENNQYSLIIPIILRGKIDCLPEEIRSNLHVYDFSGFTLCPEDVDIQSNNKYVEDLNRIGERISSLRYEMEMADKCDPCRNCDDFQLVTDIEVQELVEKAQYVPHFPGRMS